MSVNVQAHAVCAAELCRGDRIMRRPDAQHTMAINAMDMRSEAGQWLLIVSGAIALRDGAPADDREDTWVIPIDATVWRFPSSVAVVDRPAKVGVTAMAAAAVAFLGSGLWPATRREKAVRRRPVSPPAYPVGAPAVPEH